jgi:hypothetical protein
LANRLSGLVLPASSKYLIDDVIGQGRVDLLFGSSPSWPLPSASRQDPPSS